MYGLSGFSLQWSVGYVPEHVWKVLAELSYFFRLLCAKEVSRNVAIELEKQARVLVCKLEKIFPPGFFLSMQHLIVHLPTEVRLGGLCSFAGVLQWRGY